MLLVLLTVLTVLAELLLRVREFFSFSSSEDLSDPDADEDVVEVEVSFPLLLPL